MKRLPLGLATLGLLFAGCAQPEFITYVGPGIISTGLGGTHTRRDGIDVWTNGAPPRRYQILGVIERDGDRHATEASLLHSCLLTARQHHADAVMIMENDTRVPVAEIPAGGYLGRRHVRLVVIRYL